LPTSPFYQPVDTAVAARLSGLAAHTLENLRHLGGGPRFIKLGRKVMYDPADIYAWLDTHKVSSTSEALAADHGHSRNLVREA
jgi:predicted DNA-binding transcriptional regulator AlpA